MTASAPVLIHVAARAWSVAARAGACACVAWPMADGRAVQCGKGWRVGIGREAVPILAHDAGSHWRMAGDGAGEALP